MTTQVDPPRPSTPFAGGLLLAELGRQYLAVARHSLCDEAPLPVRLAQLSQQIKGFFIDLTESGTQSFSNHFARLTYVAQSAHLDPRLSYYFHQFDREGARAIRGEETRLPPEAIVQLGARALVDAVLAITKLDCPQDLLEVLPEGYEAFQLQAYTVAEFRGEVRALVLEDLEARGVLRVRLVESPGLDHFVHYTREGFNAQFVGHAVKLLRRHFTLPIEVNLLSVEVDDNGELNPSHLIIEPDYLVDVTAVAKCFDAEGPEPMRYLLGRVTPFQGSLAVLAGNVANHFLDAALTQAPGVPFRERFAETFATYPLEYAKLNDEEVRELMEKCQGHFNVIADVIARHLPSERIGRDECVVEPSFYAERYGLQGRLDVFLPPTGGRDDAAIVELKSGSVYRPNEHAINPEHYIQTLLYDLLVKSAFSERMKPRNYLLYSREKDRPLRFAPVNRARQYDALSVRNQMMAIERLLADSRPGHPCPLDSLRPDRYPTASGFLGRDLGTFHASWSNLSELERDYTRAFVGFIAREQHLAKVGTHTQERITGQAALWREDLEVKLEGYAILHALTLTSVAVKDNWPVLRFRRAAPPEDGTVQLTSFRRGDIVVLYPGDASRKAVLRNQVYKGTITQLSESEVELRLRATQPDLTRFERHAVYNVEPDLFDSSFHRLYQNLAEFASAKPDARALALGLRPPIASATTQVRAPVALTNEQARLFQAIVNAREYFLLWGPPGTGKTSVMLHHLCAHFVQHTRERILVLAFTNRAVDEICHAIRHIGGDIDQRFLRIGSSFGCASDFERQLLQTRIKHLRTRGAIRELLDQQRIVVGTVSSVLGKGVSLFDLLQFDRVFVDEASQLLEPALISLLTRFPRTVLIGDHLQLPAVVTQPANQTTVEHAGLREIGLTDLRNSLFERLFARCQVQNWDWAFGQLTRQGRMHGTLADYVSKTFYGGTLAGLGVEPATSDWQLLSNVWVDRPADCEPLETQFCEQSYVFVNTPVDLSDKAFRTNLYEAEQVLACLRSLIRIRQHAKVTVAPLDVGIITPYRAQIARIRQTILASELASEWGEVSIDTVERYQGSTYRYVLISLCANQPRTVQLLTNSGGGIDRKLNVALTRARERVIVFGNVDLLREHNAAYRHFIEHCEQSGGLAEAS